MQKLAYLILEKLYNNPKNGKQLQPMAALIVEKNV